MGRLDVCESAGIWYNQCNAFTHETVCCNYSEGLYKYNSNSLANEMESRISEKNSNLLWVATVRIENKQEGQDHTITGRKKQHLSQKLDEPSSPSSIDDPQVILLYRSNRKLLEA